MRRLTEQTISGKERLALANTFFEHLSLIGGFILIAFIDAHQQKGASSASFTSARVQRRTQAWSYR
jgi:hypothetical protein